MVNKDINNSEKDRFPLRYFLYFLIIAIVIVAAGYFYYHQRKLVIEEEFSRHIVTIKELKLQQIESEQSQRKKIIESFLNIPSVNLELTRLINSKPSPQLNQRVYELIRDLILNLGFSSVNIFNRQADLLFTTDSLYNIKQNFLKHELAGLFANDFSSLSNMYVSDNKNLIQAVIVPVKNSNEVVGFLWAEYSFFEYLSPIIGYTRQEPGDIEFILVKKDGDLAFVLRDMIEADSTVIITVPISKDDRASLKAILDDPSLVKGITFRGKKIYATVKRIFESDWSLITKINEVQVTRSIKNTALVILTIGILLLILSASITYAIWKRSRIEYLARTLRLKREKELLSERYTSLTRYANDIILTLNSDGKILEANKRATDIYGYSINELMKMNFADLSYSKALDEMSFLLPKDSGDGIMYETEHKTKDGKLVPVEISAKYIEQEGEKILIAIIRDNSERKKLQKELILAKERAEDNDKLKTIILTNMSHEFNTPMSGILGFTEILQSEIDNLEHKEMLMQIHKSSKRLNDTLTSILDLSKIESHQVELDYRKIELNSLIDETIFLHKDQIESKGLTVRSEKYKSSIIFKTDINILQKILNNVLGNAIKFTRVGVITILSDADNKNVKLTVTDTGIGIAPEKLKVIFEPFRQASEGSARHFEGTGIGLTITKRFVDLLGGTINIESEPGKGTSVMLTFPVYGKADSKTV